MQRIISNNTATDSTLIYVCWPLTHSAHGLIKLYSNALLMEINEFGQRNEQKLYCKALYISGNHFSCVSNELALDISGTLRRTLNFEKCVEITIEVNSDALINPKKIQQWQLIGVSRIIIGIHSIMQPRPVIDYLGKVFSVIVIQCSITITPDTVEHWKKYVKDIITWPIQHFSIIFMPTVYADLRINFYRWLVEVLVAHGMSMRDWYNFSFSGGSTVYMEEYYNRALLKGFGVGAESHDGKARYYNEQRMAFYLKKIIKGDSAVVEFEVLDAHNIRMEKIMLGLRANRGVPLSVVYDGFSRPEYTLVEQWIAVCLRKGFLTIQNDKLFLAPAGLGYEEEILLNLVI
jgi:coproporphyrinogen III oxidase-like Fe-S oxidoreductase